MTPLEVEGSNRRGLFPAGSAVPSDCVDLVRLWPPAAHYAKHAGTPENLGV